MRILAPVKPQPIPDEPFVVDARGVVEDVWPWIRDSALVSPDGRVIRIHKSDEVSADGQVIGEWWDADERYIGHLEDAGSGYRLHGGRRYDADAYRAFLEDNPAAPAWSALRIDRNWWSAGKRLWLPRRCETGWTRSYRTDISWTSGYVDRDVPITIRVEVGRGRVNGREVRVRQTYDPRRVDRENPRRKAGLVEFNTYGPSGWVSHEAWKDDEHGNPAIRHWYPHERQSAA